MWSRAGPKGPKARARFALYSHPIHPVLSLLGFRVFFLLGRLVARPRPAALGFAALEQHQQQQRKA